jgi:hypothetical protein
MSQSACTSNPSLAEGCRDALIVIALIWAGVIVVKLILAAVSQLASAAVVVAALAAWARHG